MDVNTFISQTDTNLNSMNMWWISDWMTWQDRTSAKKKKSKTVAMILRQLKTETMKTRSSSTTISSSMTAELMSPVVKDSLVCGTAPDQWAVTPFGQLLFIRSRISDIIKLWSQILQWKRIKRCSNKIKCDWHPKSWNAFMTKYKTTDKDLKKWFFRHFPLK